MARQGANSPSGALTVSAVVCAYTEHRWDDLVSAVLSLQEQTVPLDEIIVVSDHNPRLVERVQEAIPGVAVVPNHYGRGLSGARNTGVELARGDIVAFLDDDAVAAPDWVERLLACYHDDSVMAVGGAVEPRWTGGRPPGFPAEFDWVVGCTYSGMPRTTTTVRNLIGANMSFRREVLRAAGGFRSGLGRIGTRPLGCEETELCIRVSRLWPSARIVYEPSARVAHAVPASRASWSYFLSRCYAEGLSKAVVTRLAGPGDGLASERTYVVRTLPRGVVRGLADGLARDPAGLGRALAILAGLTVTTIGYGVGTVRRPRLDTSDAHA